ncbi:MAG: LPS export ABC transporter periplasmic protein LptC [Phycisphaerales bacterium]|nr:LPS export ABC transporter periplasmic protein LptC [Phycisphaerales bacterium]
MIRNAAILIVTGALLAALFLGYQRYFAIDESAAQQGDARLTELPESRSDAGAPLTIGENVPVEPGGRVDVTLFDPSGRANRVFSWSDWRPTPGRQDEIVVKDPALTMLMPSGMTAVVSGKEGRLHVTGAQSARPTPQAGELIGDGRVVIDRNTEPDRAPPEERPDDLIVITAERLRFDLLRGEISTEDAINVASPEFSMAGRGLALAWNESRGVLEKLTIKQGERMSLTTAGGLLPVGEKTPPGDDSLDSGEADGAVGDVEENKPRRLKGYQAVLSDNVVVRHFRGDIERGRLSADQIDLQIDGGGGQSAAFGMPGSNAADSKTRSTSGDVTREDQSSADARPAPAPASERLVVEWSGPLTLTPTESRRRRSDPRRRFTARGAPARLLAGQDREIVCGELTYYDETQQLWIRPTPGGVVDMRLGEGATATASSVFLDRKAGIIKLVGDVRLDSTPRPNTPRASVSCTLWAELYLQNSAPAESDLFGAATLRSATFVGGTRVDIGERALASNRLDVTFRHPMVGPPAWARPGGADIEIDGQPTPLAPPETPTGMSSGMAISHVVADGAVRFDTRDQTMRCAWLDVWFGDRPGSETYPERVDARGAVEVIVSRENRVAARGDRVVAQFDGPDVVSETTIFGTPQRWALVRAGEYRIRGEVIELDPRPDQSWMRVDGPARARFLMQRGMRGNSTGGPQLVHVSSQGGLMLDSRQNELRLRDQVVATSGNDRLDAEELVVFLENLDPPRRHFGANLPWLMARAAVAAMGDPANAVDAFTENVNSRSSAAVRKEPSRMEAYVAAMRSETREPGRDEPVMSQRIDAPRMVVDLKGRQLTTLGATRLLMANYRLPDRPATPEPTSESALISKGPSQTAIACSGKMTYTMGPSENGRRLDTVLFEDNVAFRHRAGSEMIDFENMLPELQEKPELRERLTARNTSLDCDRLEAFLGYSEGGAMRSMTPSAGAAPLSMEWLNAVGSIMLRDMHGATVREMTADQMTYDREHAQIVVVGGEGRPAEIVSYDAKAGTYEQPAIASKLVFDLNTNLPSAPEGVRGEIRPTARGREEAKPR